jgi:UPF0042 nucleotide-binding protein
MNTQGRRLIIVSGLSGAGKTVVLNSLEDLGFYCIDNLPISLLSAFAEQISDPKTEIADNIAIGIDARNPKIDIINLPNAVTALKNKGLAIDVTYMEANDDVLTKRFSETRRKHPLSSNSTPLMNAIKNERQIMEGLSECADMRIDTSHTLMHELRDIVRERIAKRSISSLSIQFISFGYKHGIPRDADFVFDVRCLPNPYWEKHLRGLSGKDQPVIKFLSKQKLVSDMLEQLQKFMEYWIPQFEADNRSYLCIAIGCTGGHHRSVYLAEALAQYFKNLDKHVIVNHRDI